MALGSPSDRKIALGLFALALAVRLALFPYWRHLPLGGDEGYYWNRARAVAAGDPAPDFIRPPLWSFVLAPIAGLSPDAVWGRTLGVILGAVAVSLLFALTSRAFGRRVAVVAGLAYAVLPSAVAYSHYLWTENFVSVIALLITAVFLRWLPDRPERALAIGALLAGMAVLVKEAGAIFGVAVAATLLLTRARVRPRVWLAAGALFLAPVLFYSAWATQRAGRFVFLADAAIYSANQLRHPHRAWEWTLAQNKDLFVQDLKAVSPLGFLGGFAQQVANLWTPNSFPVFRLLGVSLGNYHAPGATALAHVVIAGDLAVIVLGLTGLVFSAGGPFKTYVVSMLLGLQASGAVFFFCSRYRVPFLFPLVIYSALVVAEPAQMKMRPVAAHRGRWLLWLGLMTVVAVVVFVKWRTIGLWG